MSKPAEYLQEIIVRIVDLEPFENIMNIMTKLEASKWLDELSGLD